MTSSDFRDDVIKTGVFQRVFMIVTEVSKYREIGIANEALHIKEVKHVLNQDITSYKHCLFN